MTRLYALLLRLYPASFRHEYAAEMRAVFASRLREAGGPAGRLALWLEAIGDLAGNAVLVQWDVLRQDLAYTARSLRRSPGFAATSVIIVALGIGATTAAFSVTDFVLIRPLPFPAPDRLVKLWERTPGYARMELSPANYRDWTRGNRSFERIGAYHGLAVNMVGKGEPQRLYGAAISADLLPTLGVGPVIGRTFEAADDRAGAAGTVLLSYRLWQHTFGGDPGVVGQTLLLDREPYTVIGVMSREFRFPDREAELWTPMRLTEENYQDRGDNWLESVGRLRPGVTIDQARAEMLLAAEASSRQYPRENEHVSSTVVALRDQVSRQSRLLLSALLGAAGCVLLIACANLASLLLARALGRRRELAVRVAIGAGRERLVRQLMTESLVVAAAGGALGVAVAVSAVPLLATLVPTSLPIAETPAVDLRMLLFAGVLTALTGVAFGMAPLIRGHADDTLQGLREGVRAGGGRRERLRSALVVAEIVASVVLLVSAGLLIRALWSVQAIDPGFKTDGVLTLRTPLPMPQYNLVAAREAFYRRVLTEVRALPGVTDAAFISYLPLGLRMRGGIWPVSIGGRTALTRSDHEVAFLRYVTPGFFRALGIPVRRGRDVSAADAQARPYVAVVSESFVRQYFPDVDPIGRHFTFAGSERTIVGIVGDISVRGLERPSEPQVYLPSPQVEDGSITGYVPRDLVVRTTLSDGVTALAPSIRAIVRQADPEQPVTDVLTLSNLVELDTAMRSAQARVLAAFAVIAFVLAAVGIHGVLSFAVAQRTHEIGVRMTLGAQRTDILGMVLKRSAVLSAGGVVPGVALAYVAGRSIQALLVGVAPGDPATFAAAVGLAIVMSLAGSLAPTVRALRVDPISAIRTE